MGAFKPLLPFGGVTVVEACVESLRAAGARKVVVVVGHRAGEVRAALAGEKCVRFALNDEPESEMGLSVARGVEALGVETEAALVALVDQPAVPKAAIAGLIEARRRTGARLVVPEWEGRGGHPVLVDLSLREEIQRAGRRAARRPARCLRRAPRGGLARARSLAFRRARHGHVGGVRRAAHGGLRLPSSEEQAGGLSRGPKQSL